MEQQNARKSSNTAVVLLLCLYLGVCMVRFLLALATSAYPVINIDEFLYYGMARSIASGKGLLFRGQPANYSYILYSLILSPAFRFGLEGIPLYRVIQLWNILLISLSIFPIYSLAHLWTGNKHKAIWISGISMLLPDFMLGQLMMCENIILPLFFSAAYCIYEYLEEHRMKHILFIGLLGGLLFSAKPGAVIPAAVFLIAIIGKSVFTHNGKQLAHAAAGLAAMFCTAAFFFLLVGWLGGKASILSLYDVQVANGEHFDVFIRFIGVYLLYLLISCGVACIALAFSNTKCYTQIQKSFFYGILISLLLTIIGVSWSVNRYEYNANTAHMRYIGMYIPLLFMFSMSSAEVPEEIKLRSKSRIPLSAVVFCITALLLIITGVYSGVNQYTVYAENMTLAVIISLFKGHVSSLLVAGIILGVLIMLLILFWKNRKSALPVTVALLLGCMIVNNVAAYDISRKNTRFDYSEQANEIVKNLANTDDVLYLYTVATTTAYYGALDAYRRQNISYTTLNDMFNHLYASKGIYTPFLPEEKRGCMTTMNTPDTDTILMDATVYCMLQPSENTQHYTLDEDGLHVIKILDKAKPWLDWVVGNTKNMILSAGDKGIVLVFKDSYLQAPLTFKMTIYSEHETNLSLYSNSEMKTIELKSGKHTYEVTFDNPQDAYNFEAEQGDIRFYGFELNNESQ